MAVSLFLHALLLVIGGAPTGSSFFSGKAQTDKGQRRTWLRAQVKTEKPPPLAPVRPERVAPEPARPTQRAPEAPPAPPLPEPVAIPAPMGEEGFGILPAEIPQTEERIYYKAAELDDRAIPITPIQPMPEVAARGVVTIRLEIFISAVGTVDKVEVVSVSPDSFPTDFAVRAFAMARFDPARIAGEPVASKKTIELTYTSE